MANPTVETTSKSSACRSCAGRGTWWRTSAWACLFHIGPRRFLPPSGPGSSHHRTGSLSSLHWLLYSGLAVQNAGTKSRCLNAGGGEISEIVKPNLGFCSLLYQVWAVPHCVLLGCFSPECWRPGEKASGMCSLCGTCLVLPKQQQCGHYAVDTCFSLCRVSFVWFLPQWRRAAPARQAKQAKPVPLRLTINIHYMNVQGVTTPLKKLAGHKLPITTCSRAGANSLRKL